MIMDEENGTEIWYEPMDIGLIHKFFEGPIIEMNVTQECTDEVGNSTCDFLSDLRSPLCSIRYKPSLHIAGAIIAVVIFLVNSLVIYLFAASRSLRRTSSNYLLLSLSLIDILSATSLGLFLLPFFYLHVAGCQKLELNIGALYYVVSDQLVNFIFLASIGHLMALSTERVIAVFLANKYEKIVRTSIVWLTCAVIWVSALLISSIQLIWQRYHFTKSEENANKIVKYDRIFSLVSFLCFAVVPAIFLVVQYSSMFLFIKKNMRCQLGATRSRRLVKEWSILLTYCGMFVCYILLVFPYFMLRIAFDFADQRAWYRVPPEVPETILMLRFVVSIVNPLLYTLCKKEFRNACARCLKISRCVRCRNVPTASLSGVSHRTDEVILGGGAAIALKPRPQSDVTCGIDELATASTGLVSSYSSGSRANKRNVLRSEVACGQYAPRSVSSDEDAV